MECPDWCFAWRSIRWRPYYNIQLKTLLASWNPLTFHFPVTWCYVGCLCFAFGEWNTYSGLQRLLRCPRMCSQNFVGDREISRKFGHVGWSERPCTSVYHSLCQESWVAWSAWCDVNLGTTNPLGSYVDLHFSCASPFNWRDSFSNGEKNSFGKVRVATYFILF